MQEQTSFGEWLRKQRHALDLSRQAFADQVGCAEITLRRIEAGTLKPSKELAGILLEKLGIPETQRPGWISFARGLSGFPTEPGLLSSKPKSNLPVSITTFIGRETEQSDVIRLITKYRLVTLTGPGGVGKTRLAIKVGEQVLRDYADGVWFVEFAPILDPNLVPRITALALGLRDEPQRPIVDMVSDYLQRKQILILLDNCEHLLEACAELADTLLKRCPSLKILATSREALGILGEATYHVPSLALPDIQYLLENFRRYESVRLFEERAQLARADFFLTLDNATVVAKICTHLDGIPLAIELAAARADTFSIEQIEERLRESFRLLTTGNRTALPRHQTLQAAIDWSYDLLSPAEQSLFQRLSVFVNGWTLDAAQSVCSDANIKSEAILDLLIQLIHKSLVILDETQGKTRYHMLETMRHYAQEKLGASGESDALRDKHLDYFLSLAETAEPYLLRTEQIKWLPTLDADYENLRLAFEWALSKESIEPSQNMCRALWWFWLIRCYWLEGLRWVERALAKPSQKKSRDEKVARARVLYICAHLQWQLGNFEQMLSPAEESLALAIEASDKKDIAIARYCLGGALHLLIEDNNKALSLIEQSFLAFQELNEPRWEVYAFTILGSKVKLPLRDRYLRRLELARMAGERLTLADTLCAYADWLYRLNRIDEAKKYTEEANTLYEQIGSKNSSINPLLFADIAWGNGDYERAKSLYRELQEHFSLLGERFWTSICVLELGRLAMEESDLHQAQDHLEQALAMQREIGYRPVIADCLTDLSNLFYLQGDLEAFKQNFRESVSLKNYFAQKHKGCVLMAILGSLYPRKSELSARLMGVVHYYERESEFPLKPLEKRFWSRAEIHARKTLGDAAFESAFAEGQKMSLDEALDLALRTVEEIEQI